MLTGSCNVGETCKNPEPVRSRSAVKQIETVGSRKELLLGAGADESEADAPVEIIDRVLPPSVQSAVLWDIPPRTATYAPVLILYCRTERICGIHQGRQMIPHPLPYVPDRVAQTPCVWLHLADRVSALPAVVSVPRDLAEWTVQLSLGPCPCCVLPLGFGGEPIAQAIKPAGPGDFFTVHYVALLQPVHSRS